VLQPVFHRCAWHDTCTVHLSVGTRGGEGEKKREEEKKRTPNNSTQHKPRSLSVCLSEVHVASTGLTRPSHRKHNSRSLSLQSTCDQRIGGKWGNYRRRDNERMSAVCSFHVQFVFISCFFVFVSACPVVSRFPRSKAPGGQTAATAFIPCAFIIVSREGNGD
jgi:hypothetical protein